MFLVRSLKSNYQGKNIDGFHFVSGHIMWSKQDSFPAGYNITRLKERFNDNFLIEESDGINKINSTNSLYCQYTIDHNACNRIAFQSVY